jgi:hypothetical protein
MAKGNKPPKNDKAKKKPKKVLAKAKPSGSIFKRGGDSAVGGM